MKRLLILSLILMALVGSASASIDPADYAHYADFVVNSTTTQTDFQVKMLLDNQTDYAITDVFYTNGTTRSDWLDIAWTDNSNNLLEFWKGTETATSSVWWMNISSIADDNTSAVRLHYGNVSMVTSYINATNTFIQFHGVASSTFHDSNVMAPPLVYEARVRNTYASNEYLLWGVGESDNLDTSPGDSFSIMSYGAGNARYVKSFNDGTQNNLNEAPRFTKGTWYNLKTVIVGSANAHGYVDLNEIGAGISTSVVPNEAMGLAMHLKTGTGEQEYSFIRKYAAVDPFLTFIPSIPPAASFEITFTDTTTNLPAFWKWNATNLLGNNTEVTVSYTHLTLPTILLV